MTTSSSGKDKGLEQSGSNFAKKPLSDKIGQNLKQLYDDVVREDVPDEFLALLKKADK